MIFAEFYHDSTGWNGKDFSGPVKLIPRCGSDSVFKLDGRKSRWHQIRDARERAKQVPGVKGLRLMVGESFLFNRPLTQIITTP